jgi:peptidoglycan-associated lipoprotein
MNLSLLKLIFALALSALLIGCSSTPPVGDAGGEGMAGAGAGGYDPRTAGISASGGVYETEEEGEGVHGAGGGLNTLTIYFDYDSSDIHPDYRDVVLSHGNYLMQNPAKTLTVEGHCDERGSREYNIALGERRALTVKRMLMAQGATDRQIVTISYGEERPAVEGGGDAAWAKNRRVELVY